MAEVNVSFWRKARVVFRRFRVFFLSLVLLFFLVVFWFNYIGIPAFLTQKIRAELERQHFNLEFQRLKLSGFTRLVAENLQFSGVDSNASPTLFLPRAELLLDKDYLKHFDFRLRGIQVRGGRVEIPLSSGDITVPPLLITNIQTDLDFLQNDSWRLNNFEAQVMGAKAHASARIGNVSKLRLPAIQSAGSRSRPWQAPLRDAVDFLRQFEFTGAPAVSLEFSADAAHPESLNAVLRTDWHDLESQWGSIERLRLTCSIHPVTNVLTGRFSLHVDSVKSKQVNFTKLEAEGFSIWNSAMDSLVTNSFSLDVTNLVSRWSRTDFAHAAVFSHPILAETNENSPSPILSRVLVSSAAIDLPGVRTGSNLLTAELTHALPFQTPAFFLKQILPGPRKSFEESADLTNSISGKWEFATPSLNLKQAYAQGLAISGELRPVGRSISPRNEFGFWNYLLNYESPWKLQMSNVFAQNINIGSLASSGLWSAPQFQITSLDAKLYGGTVDGSLSLDIRSRLLSAQAHSDFDYHKAAGLLEKPVQNWLSDFAWQTPPRVQATASIHLPGWTEDWTSAKHDLIESLHLAGEFSGSGSFKEVQSGEVKSHFGYTNFVWTLPDLSLQRPDGAVLIAYSGNVTNQDFSVTIDSQVNPAILKPLFPEEQRIAFEVLDFKQPPVVQGKASGNLGHLDKIDFEGRIAVTNFAVKGVPYSDIQAKIHYTNLIIECHDFLAHRGAEEIRAPYLRVDIPREVMWVTNAVSNSDPYLAMGLVGPEILRAIDPYRFATPPTVKINGFVPLRHWSKADLHFQVAGTNFTYWKFHIPSITGDVYWKADHLSFSNVFASFYHGKGQWSGHFYINDHHSADFSFLAHVTDAEVKPLMADLIGGTNRMEGILNGILTITSANSDNMKSWDGYGNGTVKDGYLWNVPIFGIFTPVLDSLLPGVSLSRVSAAEGNFNINKSVVETRDMQVRAPAFRLNYKGTVDFDGKLDAKVDAEILRDAWVFGKLFSMALWPVSKAFEAKISGTLNDPKTKLRYFPRFLLAPLKALAPQPENGNRPQASPAQEPAANSDKPKE